MSNLAIFVMGLIVGYLLGLIGITFGASLYLREIDKYKI